VKRRLTAAIGTLCCLGPASADALPGKLVAGKSSECPLAAGETHAYIIQLQADEFLAVDVEERGVDVTLRILDSERQSLEEQRTTYSRNDTDRVRIIAKRPGQFRLEVIAGSAGGGKYLIHTLAIRPATAIDRNDVAANEALNAALRASDGKTPQDMRAAVQEFDRAMAQGRAARDINLAGDAALLAGRLSFRLDERGKAVEYTTQALAAFRATGNVKREARALNNLGAIHQEMAEPTKAIGYFTRALAILEATGDGPAQAMVLHNLGWYHQLLGEYSTASNYYRRALLTEDDSALRASTLNNLGRLNASLGDFEAARVYLQRALSECNRRDDSRCKAETLVNLGSLSLYLHQEEAARDSFTQALSAIGVTQDDVWRAKALLGLASVAKEPSTEAGAYIQTALSLVRHINDRRLEADGLQTLGNWYSARNTVDLARKTYEEALTLQRATGEMEGEAQSLLAITRLLRDTGHLEQALEQVERAIDVLESVREQVARPDLRSTYLATTQEYYDVYVDILMTLHSRRPLAGYDRKALQASERARARGLIEALAERGSDILGRSNPELLKRERALRRMLNARDQRLRMLTDGNADAEQRATIQRELDATVSELRELEGEIRSRDPSYAELTHPRALDVDALLQRLDSESVLLEYWLGTKHSFVWAVTRQGVSSYVLPPGAVIESAARQYFAHLTARPQPTTGPSGTAAVPADERPGRALGGALLGQLTSELRYRRLIVVRYSALEYIPFAALQAPAAGQENAHWLIEDHEIVNLPAISVLSGLRKTAMPAPRKTIAIFADPVFSSDDSRVVHDQTPRVADSNAIIRHEVAALGKPAHDTAAPDRSTLDRSAGETGLQTLYRLRYSRLEADAIAALVPASQRLEALDFQANRATALSHDIAQFRYLHFATHGLLDSVHPELSGLVFSTVDEHGRPLDGLLRMHEIFGLPLQADLVVLSACQTALGREIKGEGLVGLTRGFMYAGAPRVIATLWNVDDRATAELMSHFYQSLLKEHSTAAVSLRAAQLALMQDPRWSSPYYWGGVVLQGAWN
jgi:CHAT domain-containing protein/tetratricopeptide (TPR) repeat protein